MALRRLTAVDRRSGWKLFEGDKVTYNGQLYTVKQNHRWQNSAVVVQDGWAENISWAYLKKVKKQKKTLEVTNHGSQH